MNKRIKELMINCNYVVDGTCDTSREQKFAELIVRECISICLDKERPNLYGVREVEEAIKKHFGVEE